MQNKVYVGNLSYAIDDAKLKELFSLDGIEITEAKVITDKFSGRSKGFGFVTFANDEMAQKAIKEMDGKDVEGRGLKVNIARPIEERPSSARGFNRNFR